jgi:alkylated DNA nucleotide flippase Atl1
MSKTGLFLGGVPTEPDVQRLIEAVPNLKPGDEVPYQDIASTIGEERNSSRYKTVVGRWRKQMRKLHNIDMKAIAGFGFRVLNANERVAAGVSDYGKNVRGVVRSEGRIRSAPAEAMNQQQQGVREHVLRHIGATVDAARRASKEIAVKFTPQAQLARGERPAR